MLGNYLAIRPFIGKNLQNVSFAGNPFSHEINEKNNNYKRGEFATRSEVSFLAKSKYDVAEENRRLAPKKPPASMGPFMILPDKLPVSLVREIRKQAYEKEISVAELMSQVFKNDTYIPPVMPVDSKSAVVGNTRVTTLIDGDQIFNKTIELIDHAQHSIQVEMFEFQNLSVDGDTWKLNGAQKLKNASSKQYQILSKLIDAKETNPDMKIQVILDAHKWYIDSNGVKRHHGNQKMIKYLKENGIDVVPYPRQAQQGAALQHVKLMVVDGKKAILGGMNWGTHSAANHDACVAVETLPKKNSSEVDNIAEEIFNADWKFSWQRLGATKLMSGPLTKKEQKNYRGINKEIKPENVEYMRLVGDLYNNPTDRNRYKEGRLDLIPTNAVEEPKIQVLATKPKELEKVGLEGKESIRNYIMDRVKTCKSIRAELFVLTDKEIVETLINRIESGDIRKEDIQIIIDPSIKEIFPYCENGYDKLVEHGVPVRVYKVDETVNQRMHGKWAIFDDKEVLIGSANWSAMGLNQNIGTGLRDDYDLTTEMMEKEIAEYFETVQEDEDEFGFPPLDWYGDSESYGRLKSRLSIYRKAEHELNKKGETKFEIEGKEYVIKNDEDNTNLSKIQTIKGYYERIQKRHNAKEKYKRGNNEMAIAYESPNLAKNVYKKQFDRDWKYSQSDD